MSGGAAVRWHCQVILAAVCAALLLSACALPAAPWQPRPLAIVVGQDRLLAEDAALSGAAAIPSAQAVQIAKQYVPIWAQARAVTARHVALTLRSNEGKVAWGVQDRAVWLVEFAGVRYAPPADPNSECACDRLFQPPNTAVAVDAHSGELVIDYGFAGS